MIDWVIENKDWLFSGLGIAIIPFIWKFFSNKENLDASQNQVINITMENSSTSNKNIDEHTEVSNMVSRFNQFKDLLNENRYDGYTIAGLARILKLNSIGELENIFLGKVEPSFRFIKYFCDTFGINREWLIEGKNKPFYYSKQTNYDPYQYLDYILNAKPERVYFIRSSSEIGEVFILLKFNAWKFEVLHRVWNISSYVGSGGQSQIYGMYKLIMALKAKMYMKCYGRILPQDKFDLIFEGSVFPSSIIDYRGMQENPWWEDFTDVYHEYFSAENYRRKYSDEFISAQNVVRHYLERENYESNHHQ